jgi:AmmeMemoRadiSam system protein A
VRFYEQQSKKDGDITLNLSNEEKKQLKHLARDAVECALFGKKQCKIELSKELKEKAGAFVTLKSKGELRGCIGHISAVMPLSDVVEKMAIQSAFHDPRFCGLQKDEWKDIDIEISVISPMRKIENIKEIEVGVHGLYVEKKGHSGLLLPQVATEYHWDRETFLEYTCYKAGLAKDAWKSADTKIYIFSAEVF